MDSIKGNLADWAIMSPIPQEVSDEIDESRMLAHLLYVRGYHTPDAIDDFLKDEQEEYDYRLLPDIKRAVASIRRHDKVVVVCDYDSDGVASGALMTLALQRIGKHVHTIVPTRTEGHGIVKSHVDQAKAWGATLIVTVDNGTNSLEEVAYAKKLGIKVIITDHHVQTGDLPDCPVVNPNRKDSTYPFGGLAGVGVAYKVVQAFTKGHHDDFLDLVALGTVADVVPLREENRVFVKKGLDCIKSNQRMGIMALISASDIELSQLSEEHISFYIAPKINAANRIGDPRVAFDLLTTDDFDESERLCATLVGYNEERQELLGAAVEKAMSQAEPQKGQPIILVRDGWLPGLSGLIASKITDKYKVPSIVAAEEGLNVTASARSVAGVNIIRIIEEAHKASGGTFLRYGGHEGAAGFSVAPDKWETATAALLEAAKASPKPTSRASNIDAEIKMEQVSLQSINRLQKLAPFGHKFPEPVFLMRNVRFVDKKTMKEKHIRGILTDGDETVRALMFNHDPELEKISENQFLDIVFTMQANYFAGRTTAQVRIIDWKRS